MGLVSEYVVGGYQAGEGALVFKSQDWRPGGRLVVLAHSSGGSALSYHAFRRDMARLVAGGNVIVIAADLGGINTWGNDTVIARITSLIAWAATVYGARTTDVSFIGDSMGMLGVLNWAWRNPSQVGWIVGRVPVVALDAFHDRNPLGLAATIETAYGGSGPYEAAIATHDPMASGPQTALTPLRSRILLLWATDDTVAIPAEVTAFKAATGCATLPLGAVGHAGPNYYGSIPDVYQAQWLLQAA